MLNRRTLFYAAAGSTVLPRIGTSAERTLRSALDDASRSAVDSGALPMVVSGITDANGTLYEGAFGRRSASRADAATVDSVFYFASMTKPLTAVAAMQLVESGKLTLDDPVSRTIEDAGKLQVIDGFDSSGKPVMRKPRSEITLRQLLTHTAGFGQAIWDDKVKRYAAAAGELRPSVEGDAESWLHPLVSDPGTRWEYSSVSIDWVGRLVALASGKRFGDYMRENILAPLDMRSTDYVISPDMLARKVDNHQRKSDGSFEVIPFTGQRLPVREYGSGGLYGPAPDYLKFVRMMLNNGRSNGVTLLKPETVELMARNNMGAIRVGLLPTAMPNLSREVEFFPGVEKTWGLSVLINEQRTAEGRPAGSLCWSGLFNTHFWIDRSNGVGGVYLSQILPFMDERAIEGFNRFEKSFYSSRA